MYALATSKRFRRQFRRLQKNKKNFDILNKVIQKLQAGQTLSRIYQDHRLKGELRGFRECHLAPDWLLVYRQYDDILILELIATGSHSQLFK